MAERRGLPLSAVTEALRLRVADGHWPDGHRLPDERSLAAEFGLARNTLRKALAALEAEGWLIRHVGRGTFVRHAGGPPAIPSTPTPVELQAAGPEPLASEAQDQGPFGAGAALAWVRQGIADGSSLTGLIAGSSPAEVMEARLVIEPHVAALAAQRADAADLAAIDWALKQSLRTHGIGAFEHWDGELHLAIFRAARNALLAGICVALNGVRTQARWHRLKVRTVTPERRSLYDRQHGDVVMAIRDRDPDAARRLLHAHLAAVQAALLAVNDG